ncbi:hypothetical protein ABE402_05975 [Bacillus smithii]|uniref:hypothetical protein n=1 Tax=Bacillus smithii TaxID=1479 RepID=UPI003D1C82F3
MDNLERFELATTVSGKTFKFFNHPKANFLIDLPNKMILGITSSISCIDCYLPDENEIYHYAGDISFGNDNGINYLNFHSRSISALSFNNEKVQIPKSSNALCNVRIELQIDKSIKWFDSVREKF